MEQAPVQIGQFILGKNLGIGAFGKVRIGQRPAKEMGSKRGINDRSLRQNYMGFPRCFTRDLVDMTILLSCLSMRREDVLVVDLAVSHAVCASSVSFVSMHC